jgi:hypothetical protein
LKENTGGKKMKEKTVFERLKKPGKSLYILLFLLLVIVLVYSIYNNNREKFMGSLETIVYAPGHFISGTDTSLRVIILDRKSLQPVAGANVSILLKEEKTGREKLTL